MAQNECEYSELKTTLLKVWVPAVGVQSVPDLWINLLGELRSTGLMKLYTMYLNHFKNSRRFIEKHTSFRNNVNDYFDKEPPFEVSESFLSGSWSEGLFLFSEHSSIQLSDMDFMCVLRNISFSQEDQARGNLLLREDTPFVYAFITGKEKLNMWNDYLEDEVHSQNKRRLSSRKLKEKLEKNYEYIGNLYCYMDGEEERESVAEGAALTISKPKPAKSYKDSFAEGLLLYKPVNKNILANILEPIVTRVYDIYYKIVPSSDIVLAISCDGWPSCAREWTTRERFWPDVHSAQKIIQSGFYIVPKSSPDGDFRLSFSRAETKLIETLSPLQHKVLKAFKAVVKYYQNTWSPKHKDTISSYHLKTIAFWHLEKTPQETWTEDTLVHHLVALLEELAEALQIQTLPMYFMPKVNLFKEINDVDVMVDFMERILQISSNFFVISKAVKSISSSDNFKARVNELKSLFKTLKEEPRKE